MEVTSRHLIEGSKESNKIINQDNGRAVRKCNRRRSELMSKASPLHQLWAERGETRRESALSQSGLL